MKQPVFKFPAIIVVSAAIVAGASLSTSCTVTTLPDGTTIRSTDAAAVKAYADAAKDLARAIEKKAAK